MEELIFLLIMTFIVVLVFALIMYNILVRSKYNVKRSAGLIDVYLKKRFDLIPNLVETVKEYVKYEQEILERVTKLRNKYDETRDLKTGENLDNQVNQMVAMAEEYPDLKANQEFLNLQKNLSKIESELQAARRIYNNDVANFNILIHSVPFNIIAAIFRFKDYEFFSATEEERKNIKI